MTLTLEPDTVTPINSELILVNKLNVYLGSEEEHTDAMFIGDKSASDQFINVESIPHNVNSVSVAQRARSYWRAGQVSASINGDVAGLSCSYQYL